MTVTLPQQDFKYSLSRIFNEVQSKTIYFTKWLLVEEFNSSLKPKRKRNDTYKNKILITRFKKFNNKSYYSTA